VTFRNAEVFVPSLSSVQKRAMEGLLYFQRLDAIMKHSVIVVLDTVAYGTGARFARCAQKTSCYHTLLVVLIRLNSGLSIPERFGGTAVTAS
jgi:hypothetical protein